MNINELITRHNNLVKPEYICNDKRVFNNWLAQFANDEEQYIEIASNETLSGHAEILDW